MFLVVIGFWCYYFWGNRKKYFPSVFRNSGTEVSDNNSGQAKLQKKLDSLQAEYDYLYKLCSSDSTETDTVKVVENDSEEIAELREENAELRRELDQIKNSRKIYNTKSETANAKTKNEKPLPIARNSNAAELQKFLTELYGDR